LEKLTGRHHLEDLAVDEKMNRIFGKLGEKIIIGP
jgi:hypothetical protein